MFARHLSLTLPRLSRPLLRPTLRLHNTASDHMTPDNRIVIVFHKDTTEPIKVDAYVGESIASIVQADRFDWWGDWQLFKMESVRETDDASNDRLTRAGKGHTAECTACTACRPHVSSFDRLCVVSSSVSSFASIARRNIRTKSSIPPPRYVKCY